MCLPSICPFPTFYILPQRRAAVGALPELGLVRTSSGTPNPLELEDAYPQEILLYWAKFFPVVAGLMFFVVTDAMKEVNMAYTHIPGLTLAHAHLYIRLSPTMPQASRT